MGNCIALSEMCRRRKADDAMWFGSSFAKEFVLEMRKYIPKISL